MNFIASEINVTELQVKFRDPKRYAFGIPECTVNIDKLGSFS